MRFCFLFILLSTLHSAAFSWGTIEINATGLIRIGLVKEAKKARLHIKGRTRITDLKTGIKYKISKNISAGIYPHGKNGIRIGTLKFGPMVRIIPLDGEDKLKLNGKSYHGNILVRSNGNSTITVIEELDIEKYLLGVLPNEMGPKWPLEALKAQAVAARTYALYNLKRFDKSGYDLSADVKSQVYGASESDNPRIIKAVRSTKGEVLVYKGELVHAFYHANCGGRTSPPVWGGKYLKPLRGVSSRYAKYSKNYKWRKTISSKTILRFLKYKGLSASKVKKIYPSKRNKAKRVIVLNFVTNKGSKKIRTSDFRHWLGSASFKSLYIEKIKRKRGGFQFSGRGYGHGSGMCQDSAKEMAKRGKSYKSILKYFYTGAKIKKWKK